MNSIVTETETGPQLQATLIGFYGSDETIARAAWVSGGRQRGRTLEDVERLIRHLAKEGHDNPFERVVTEWHIVAPQRIGVQILRHRLSSPNVASARYGHKFDRVYETPIPLLVGLQEAAEGQIEAYNKVLEKTKHLPLADRKRIREVAAMYLPQGTIVEHDIMFNLRSLRNFLNLRLKGDAQPEVTEIARQMKQVLSEREEIRHAFRYFIERQFEGT